MRYSIVVTIIIASILFYPSLLYSGNDYFWAGDKKINVVTDRSNLVVVFKQDKLHKNQISAFLKLQDLKEATISDDKRITSLTFRRNQTKSQTDIFKNTGVSQSDIEWYSFGYSAEGMAPFRPTNHISFKLKKGYSTQSLEKIIKEKATIDKTPFGTEQIKINGSDVDILSLANEIYESGIAEYSLPDFIANITHCSDPLYPDQYYLNNTGQFGGLKDMDIEAPEGWMISKGSPSITVAVIDNGVEAHNDLQDESGNSRIIGGYTPQNGGDGSFSNPADNHGEACAGIIAASHNNINVRGVAPNVKLLRVNIFAENTTNDQIADGINWAWQHGADVLSNSWGFIGPIGSTFSWPSIVDAITAARTSGRNGKGSVVVFAAGNNYPTDPYGYGPPGYISFPAKVTGVLCVSATNRWGNLSSYSSRGSRIDVTAFGGEVGSDADIRTLDRMGANGKNSGDDMTNFNGTSAACPQVAGLAALILSVSPHLTEQQVRDVITTNVDDMGTAGKDDNFGYGRINILRTVGNAYKLFYPDNEFAYNNLSLNYVDSPNMVFLAAPRGDIAAGSYTTDRYEFYPTLNKTFFETPTTWWLGPTGYSFANPNYSTYYLLQNISRTQIQYRTVFYYLKVNLGSGATINQWVPYDPNASNIEKSFTYLGRPERSVSANVANNWNMVSVPAVVYDFAKTAVYPNSNSVAYAYEGGYVEKSQLANGTGYWLKFPNNQLITYTGAETYHQSINVTSGWNLIGSLSTQIPTTKVTTSPTGIISSNYFKYQNGYQTTTTLDAGGGYWVKVNQNGTLSLDASTTPGTVPNVCSPPPPSPAGEPAAPLLALPADWSYGVSTSPTLNWYASGGAISYHLQGSTNSTFSTLAFDQNNLTNTSTVVTGLANNTTYYWRVNASNSYGTSVWCCVFQFTTQGAPDPCQGVSSLASFDEFIVTDASGNSQPLYVVNGDRELSTEFNNLEMPPKHRIRHFGARFNTNRFAERVSPDGNPHILRIRIDDANYPLTLHWNTRKENRATYRLIGRERIPLSGNGSTTIENGGSNAIIIVAQSLPPCEEAKTSIGRTDNENQLLPQTYSVKQNYPNPFNPTTLINYQLPEESRVTLNIYNTLGQEVALLVNEVQGAGYKTARFDASTLPSGVYYYRIQADPLSGSSPNFIEMKKMLLVK